MYSTLTNNSMLVQEDDYKEYFDNTTTGVIYLDVNHRIKNMNNEAKRICHIDHHDDDRICCYCISHTFTPFSPGACGPGKFD